MNRMSILPNFCSTLPRNFSTSLSSAVSAFTASTSFPSAPKRKQTVSWREFIRSHRDVLVGMDFFTAEVRTFQGLLTYYVLFFIHLETRRVSMVGFTPYPDQEWMEQQARNMTMEEWGCLRGCRYLLHDRDTKFCQSFRGLIKGSVNPLRLPARSPNLNSYAERWVRSVKEECLAKLILVGESSLRRALQQYLLHYHEERNHQGKENRILFRFQTEARREEGAVRCRERLGGLLKYTRGKRHKKSTGPRAMGSQ